MPNLVVLWWIFASISHRDSSDEPALRHSTLGGLDCHSSGASYGCCCGTCYGRNGHYTDQGTRSRDTTDLRRVASRTNHGKHHERQCYGRRRPSRGGSALGPQDGLAPWCESAQAIHCATLRRSRGS